MMKLEPARILHETSTRYVLPTPILVRTFGANGKFVLADVIRVRINDDDTVEVEVHDVDDPAGSWLYLADETEDEILEALGIESERNPADVDGGFPRIKAE